MADQLRLFVIVVVLIFGNLFGYRELLCYHHPSQQLYYLNLAKKGVWKTFSKSCFCYPMHAFCTINRKYRLKYTVISTVNYATKKALEILYTIPPVVTLLQCNLFTVELRHILCTPYRSLLKIFIMWVDKLSLTKSAKLGVILCVVANNSSILSL